MRSNYDEAGLEKLKLEDGIHIHEETKVQLEVYARENGVQRVKPFMLVVAKDIDHANAIRAHDRSGRVLRRPVQRQGHHGPFQPARRREGRDRPAAA